jgi:tRNA1(Val) A37 N6-methylase TrmN6
MSRRAKRLTEEPVSRGKRLGAFYTPTEVAEFLVWWAVRAPEETVVDPSFGAGVFLRAACKRLGGLGGQPAGQVFGVEIDAGAHERVARELSAEFGVPRANLFLGDYFDADGFTMREADAVVGNPPFIRYHLFSGEPRRRALRWAAREGVRLSELSSSWARFLVRSVGMLKRGGRLAMVLPMEIAHAAYAVPVLDHLSRSFGRVTFVTFRKKLFPQLSEDTLLLLGEDKGARCSEFLWRDLPDAASLERMRGRHALPAARRVDQEGMSRGTVRLVEHFISRRALELYRELRSLALTKRLGQLVDVGIGYVTGANEFFHLHPDEARIWGIPDSFLRPAVCRGRALTGLKFTMRDWRKAVEVGEAALLLCIEDQPHLPAGLRRYLRNGEARGVNEAYKCRTRSPWFRVPHVYLPDGFLSYMSGAAPRLVANDAAAVAPNSLHILRLRPEACLARHAIAALWQTSLTRLSAEIEGHPLGGGMLKLEPSEAENVLLACPSAGDGVLVQLAEELDALVRTGGDAAAQTRADTAILKERIGLGDSDCDLLRKSAQTLQKRRLGRAGRP